MRSSPARRSIRPGTAPSPKDRSGATTEPVASILSLGFLDRMMVPKITALLFPILLMACEPLIEPEPEPTEPEPELNKVVCANGAPAADDPSLCKRGAHPIRGIDTIPLGMIKVTNKEMQKMFVHADKSEDHIRVTGEVLCNSYVTESLDCEFRENRTRKDRRADTITTGSGLAPFAELLDVTRDDDATLFAEWLWPEMQKMREVRLAAYPIHPNGAPYYLGDGTNSYLIVASAGNDKIDSMFDNPGIEPPSYGVILQAIEDHKLIFVAGWDREDGRYVRASYSTGCKGVDQGCLWAPFWYRQGGGTSFSAPHVAGAIASILSVFPDTSYQDLAKLSKLCAIKQGSGIEQLLQRFGGIGVADFSCMGPITNALAGLPIGATINVTINEGTVQVSEQRLTVHR